MHATGRSQARARQQQKQYQLPNTSTFVVPECAGLAKVGRRLCGLKSAILVRVLNDEYTIRFLCERPQQQSTKLCPLWLIISMNVSAGRQHCLWTTRNAVKRQKLVHTAFITSSSAPPRTEAKPVSVETSNHAPRRRPLSAEQRRFLDSAVRIGSI